MSLRYGIHLGALNPRSWVDAAVAADELGFDSVWIPEHLVVPLDATGSPHEGAEHSPIPSNVPMFDALSVLNHLAARTHRIGLGTNVYNIGLRHPFITARAAATVDVFSNGRLLLGIGASWLRSEWNAVGLDFDQRGARVDEAVDVCRRLWTEEVVEHHGPNFDFGPTAFEPKPVQELLPLHIGGDGKAALRRAATVGAGWMPMNHSIEELPAAIEQLHELAAGAGRTVPLEVTVPFQVESSADVERLVSAGVTRVIVRPWKRSREAIPAMEAFAKAFLQA
jgi:probable F420-dependent oxidoreductase